MAGMRPNNSFKPTPCRGVGRVHALRLHTAAAPPRVGLTQALGRIRETQLYQGFWEARQDGSGPYWFTY